MRRKELFELGFSALPTVPRSEIAVCSVYAPGDYLAYPCAEYAGQKLTYLSRSWTFIPHHESARLSMFCFAWGIGRMSLVDVEPEPGRCYAFAPGGVAFATPPWRRGEIWESPLAPDAEWKSVGHRPEDQPARSRFRV